MSFTVEADFAGARNQKAPRPSLLWYTVAFCGKINGDGVERVHLQEIINRIDQRLESLGISALEAERRAGRRDAIRNMRRAVARGKGGVTMRTIDALAPALSATSEWLLTGQDKIEADETTEIIPLNKRSPLDDDRVIDAFALAFQSLVGKLITEVEASILARSVVRIIRLPEVAMTQAERRDMIRASVRLFRH
jgi:transcriptional regulator with XRE-family HTH domain